MTDDEVRAAVTAVKGVGPWTAQMFLIFHLGRPDVMPVADLGVRKAVQRVWGLAEPPDEERLGRISRRWAPFRTVASWYMWRVLDVTVPGC